MKTKTKQEQINEIVKAVAKVTGVTEQTMMSRLRREEVVEARWIAWFFMHTHMGLQLAVIGRKWGKGFDHATVIHGLKQIAYKLTYGRDWQLRPTMEDVAEELGIEVDLPKAQVKEVA